LQAYLPDRKREPVPFWKCLKKLDKEKPSLHLKKTLEALYSRAALVVPGPLTRLMRGECLSPLSEAEKQLVSKVANHLERTPNEPLPELDHYLPIFDRTLSKLGAALRQRFARRPRADDRQALASLGFLDFYWQHRSWRDRYEQPIIQLYDIAVVLEHQPFVDKIKPLLFGDYIDVPRWLRSRERVFTRRRQQKRRSTIKSAPAVHLSPKKRPRRARPQRFAASRPRSRKKHNRKP
jgi:hypothetical protein